MIPALWTNNHTQIPERRNANEAHTMAAQPTGLFWSQVQTSELSLTAKVEWHNKNNDDPPIATMDCKFPGTEFHLPNNLKDEIMAL